MSDVFELFGLTLSVMIELFKVNHVGVVFELFGVNH